MKCKTILFTTLLFTLAFNLSMASKSIERSKNATSDGIKPVLVDKGIFEVDLTGEEDMPIDSPEPVKQFVEFKLIRSTDRIEAKKGTQFGIIYKANTGNDSETFTARIEHPAMTDKSGKTWTQQSFRSICTKDENTPFLFRFDYDYEMAKGIWTFKIIKGQQTLLIENFTIY